MEELKQNFRESMGRLGAGVTVVTTEVEGRPWGMTVSASCSVSMEPLLILISLASGSASAVSIKELGKFGVSILSKEQVEVAKAGAKPGAPKFFEDFVDSGTNGHSPAIKGALAHIDCEVDQVVEAGDHTIFIGEVKDVSLGEFNSPLLYFHRSFGSFNTELSV